MDLPKRLRLMTDKTNIHSLPNADASKVLYDRVKRAMPDTISMYPLVAKLRMECYKAHLKEGFTEAQALAICIEKL